LLDKPRPKNKDIVSFHAFPDFLAVVLRHDIIVFYYSIFSRLLFCINAGLLLYLLVGCVIVCASAAFRLMTSGIA
jgi:hypothetical protein